MIALIGGSGSTGSSLLKNILNRHPQVFAGDESNLFCKKKLYYDFQLYKKSITKRGLHGLKNHGWHIYNGVDFDAPEYEITPKEINTYIVNSQDFISFNSYLQDHFTKGDHSKIWIEKTPSNSANFADFLDTFDSGKIIHIVRNPLDTIASLISRGYSLYYATGIYLLNTGSGLSHHENQRCLTIKYEDLVNNSVQTVKSICKFLNISFESKMLITHHEKIENSQLAGWNYDETANIGTQSVGRFAKLSIDAQLEIYNAINKIQINQDGLKYYKINHKDILEISQELGYNLPSSDSLASSKKLKKEMKKDRWQRIIRLYPTGLTYPLQILD